MVKGWAADITPLYDKEIYIKYFERLPRFRKEKAMAQADPLKRVQSVAAWSLWEKLRKKYRLPKETVFNLSHSGEFVMCAVCMGGDLAEGKRIQVGCDIQQIGRAREHLAKRYFCGSEYEAVMSGKTPEERADIFYRYWVLKESFLKATRFGMKLSLDSFEIRLGNPPVLIRKPDLFRQDYYYREYEHPNKLYKMAICSTEKRDCRRYRYGVAKKLTGEFRLRRMLVIGIAIGLVAGVLCTGVAAKSVLSKNKAEFAAEKEKLKKKTNELKEEIMKHEAANNSAEALGSDKEGWALVLVNDSHPLDVSYVPESMVELESERFVDARIEEPLRQMLDDGAKAGLSMYVASAYRSSEKQKEVFNATMQDWMANGRTPLEAYDETKKSVAVPGTSEHATGLAVDIIASEYEGLDDRQGETDEQKWLMEHCWEYGFILRYPPEKVDITGIIYEPWHYRYVGKTAAEEIMKKNLTLEEYLLQ